MERLDDQQDAVPKSHLPPKDGKKVEILPGAEPDGSACTFCIHHEDHTLGNMLRYMIMQDPDVEFCGYSAPHPSEPLIHVRIQMHDGKSAIEAAKKALDNLEKMIKIIKERYDEELAAGDYETYETPRLDMAAIKKMAAGDSAGDVSMQDA